MTLGQMYIYFAFGAMWKLVSRGYSFLLILFSVQGNHIPLNYFDGISRILSMTQKTLGGKIYG